MAKQNKLRIIAGEWRGSLIDFPQAEGLRPTPDRVRETLFNWLGQTLDGKTCLDLFAGSGALGFEALSRGARRVVMVEQNPQVLKALRENARKLGANGHGKNAATEDKTRHARFPHPNPLPQAGRPLLNPLPQAGEEANVEGACFDLGANVKGAGFNRLDLVAGDGLKALSREGKTFDVIFLDPPFHRGILPLLLPLLSDRLAPDGLVYAETEQALEPGEGWEVWRSGRAGNVFYCLLKQKTEGP
jgi:16S rRNA (guanine966-N2)-methyltransferase